MPEDTSPVWHPFTQMKGAGPFPRVVSARGSRLFLEDGSELIDAIASWWVITHGHCEPAIVEAIQRQVEVLDQVIFAGFTHPVAEELAQALVDMTPDPLTHVFFSDDGSTAVEVSLKMAIQSCRQKGEPQRNLFLAFKDAYHGDTVGAMSVGDDSVFNENYQDMMFRVVHAEHPTLSTSPISEWLADFHRQIETLGDRLAGVILEPLVQGSGGMIVWPEEAVIEIVKTCREKGIYVIFDEVMTGFGRTGALFAMEKLGVSPDLVAMSKGLTAGMLPLSVTLATDEIYDSFYSDDRTKTFFHGHSFTANAVTCAAALANIKLLRERDMATEWARIESIHRQRMAGLRRADILRDSRICGTIAAVEIEDQQTSYLSPLGPSMYARAQEHGVLLRPLGNILYILPPYCISDGELNQAWDALESCLDLAAELAR